MKCSQARSNGRRILLAVTLLFLGLGLAYFLWDPGLDIDDGRHDRASNGIWMAHGWLGADAWFRRYDKTNELSSFRDPQRILTLARHLREHHITDLFPHLCPAGEDGRLPPVDPIQVERFLDGMADFRVWPWIGGLKGTSVLLFDPAWRATFIKSTRDLLATYPRLAGVHLNIEPLPNGNPDYLVLLEELRSALPTGRRLSVAAYPPPTLWHPHREVHWDEAYYRQISCRCDQLVVMMYDAAQSIPKTYEQLVSDWTMEVLAWTEGTEVLLGLPTYEDAESGYHDPDVENLYHALRGLHRGLSRNPVPPHYRGVALYAEWETNDEEWAHFRDQFLARKPAPGKPPPSR